MADRSTAVTALGLILLRMNRLAETVGGQGVRVEEARSEAAALAAKWRRLAELLDRGRPRERSRDSDL
jgi:hypothetical protein